MGKTNTEQYFCVIAACGQQRYCVIAVMKHKSNNSQEQKLPMLRFQWKL